MPSAFDYISNSPCPGENSQSTTTCTLSEIIVGIYLEPSWKIRRGLVLVLLGCIYNGLLDFDFAHLRYASVLGRIGLSWMFAALLFLNVRTRVRMGVVALLFIGYWALLACFPALDKLADQLLVIYDHYLPHNFQARPTTRL